jgi:hypothetical protein
MKLLRWLPYRRVEVLLFLLLILGCLGLSALMKSMFGAMETQFFTLIILEIILPVGAGLISAQLLAGDPLLDILLSAFRPGWQALVERLLFTGGIVALLASTILATANAWAVPLPKEGSALLYIWLSPTMFYLGLGSTVSLIRGKISEGMMAVLGVMGTSLLVMAQIPRWCAGLDPTQPCILWLASPFMTLGNAGDAYWPINRIFWLLCGVILLAATLRLAQREEPLLHEVTSE